MIMAEDLDDSISVRILFDKEKSRVICAEAGSDFVDILFSFLTLPMGAIVRLVQKQNNSGSAPNGCFSNLYQSVNCLSLDNFNTDQCKDMLLYPKNPLEIFFKDLKVKVNDTPIIYFVCSDMACPKKELSYYKNVECSCGELLNREVSEWSSSSMTNGEGDIPKRERVEVFVKRSATYLITDNMKVMRCAPGTLIELLRERGFDNVNMVGEKDFKVSQEKILNLLVHTLQSKTPLTDVFLSNQMMMSGCIIGDKKDNQVTSNSTSTKRPSNSVEIKIFISKSNQKLLYAETMEDFVELLFSFLRFPLSNVVSCLGGDSPFECVNNLYKSVQGLGYQWFVDKLRPGSNLGGSFLKKLLVNPGIAPNFAADFNCFSDKLKLCMVRNREIFRMTINKNGELRALIYDPDGYSSKSDSYLRNSVDKSCEYLTITKHKAPQGEDSSLGLLKAPAIFLVSDTLVIKPCDRTYSNVSFLKGLGVSFDDIEEYTIRLNKQEVLSILKASLSTNSAFSPVLNLLSKNRKQDCSEIILD